MFNWFNRSTNLEAARMDAEEKIADTCREFRDQIIAEGKTLGYDLRIRCQCDRMDSALVFFLVPNSKNLDTYCYIGTYQPRESDVRVIAETIIEKSKDMARENEFMQNYHQQFLK